MKLFWIVQGLLFVMLLPSIDALYAHGFAKGTLVYYGSDTLRPAKCIKKVCKRALRKQTKVLSYNFEKKCAERCLIQSVARSFVPNRVGYSGCRRNQLRCHLQRSTRILCAWFANMGCCKGSARWRRAFIAPK